MKPVRRIDPQNVRRGIFSYCQSRYGYSSLRHIRGNIPANRQRKPILIHCEQGKAEMPDWLFATIPHSLFF